MLPRKIFTNSVAGLLGLSLTTLAGCQNGNAMAEAASRGSSASYENGLFGRTLNRLYAYYPSAEVYHSPYQDRFFWKSGGNWTSGVHLPNGISVDDDNAVMIALPSAHPGTYHARTLALYPEDAFDSNAAYVSAPTGR